MKLLRRQFLYLASRCRRSAGDLVVSHALQTIRRARCIGLSVMRRRWERHRGSSHGPRPI